LLVGGVEGSLSDVLSPVTGTDEPASLMAVEADARPDLREEVGPPWGVDEDDAVDAKDLRGLPRPRLGSTGVVSS